MAQMIIANRLRDGIVVFLAPGEDWETSIARGIVIEDAAEATQLLATAKRHEAECRVVDPTLIEVETRDGRPHPTEIREAIRAFGPTVRTDLTEV
jgi:nucleotide-binding universal stress UspA family protein